MTQTVFVTGATGFIAQHVIDQLLKEKYKVIGTVRTKEKGDKLVELFNNHDFSYQIVKELAESKGDFDNALKAHPDIEIVLHTASPVFPTYYEDAVRDSILPAINGTKNILTSIEEYGKNVKRFVYTSSDSAICSDNKVGPDIIEDETSWNNVKWDKDCDLPPDQGYQISKTFAEREVWNFVKEKKPSFKVTAVNPVLVLGPQLFEYTVAQLNYSTDLVGELITGSSGENYQKFQDNFIDVRDVAKAHLCAFQREDTIGKRLLMKDVPINEQTILDIVNDKFPQLRGKIPKGVPGSDEEVFRNSKKLDSSKTKELLGFELIPLERSIYEAVDQLIKVKGIR